MPKMLLANAWLIKTLWNHGSSTDLERTAHKASSLLGRIYQVVTKLTDIVVVILEQCDGPPRRI